MVSPSTWDHSWVFSLLAAPAKLLATGQWEGNAKGRASVFWREMKVGFSLRFITTVRLGRGRQGGVMFLAPFLPLRLMEGLAGVGAEAGFAGWGCRTDLAQRYWP